MLSVLLRMYILFSNFNTIFFPRVILYIFLSILLIYGGLRFGVWGLCLELGFWGLGFQLIGFWACGVRPSGVFGVEALYINIYE